MFNSAIQTLSEMAIADNGTKIPQTTKVSVVEEVKSFLDGLDTIPVSECKFSAEMVPVRESKRFGKYNSRIIKVYVISCIGNVMPINSEYRWG